jgi:hypothetical protein
VASQNLFAAIKRLNHFRAAASGLDPDDDADLPLRAPGGTGASARKRLAEVQARLKRMEAELAEASLTQQRASERLVRLEARQAAHAKAVQVITGLVSQARSSSSC